MTKNERVYGVHGTIGNGEELINARRRVEPTHSYHVSDKVTGELLAIRYDPSFIGSAVQNAGGACNVSVKPIFRQYV